MASPSGLRAELDRRQNFTADVLALFRSRPHEWIDTSELAVVGGSLAWRTRVADARKVVRAEGGRIENKQIRDIAVERDGEQLPSRLLIGRIISLYRYSPFVPLGRPANIPTGEQLEMFT